MNPRILGGKSIPEYDARAHELFRVKMLGAGFYGLEKKHYIRQPAPPQDIS